MVRTLQWIFRDKQGPGHLNPAFSVVQGLKTFWVAGDERGELALVFGAAPSQCPSCDLQPPCARVLAPKLSRKEEGKGPRR